MSPSLPLCGHPACAGTARCLRPETGTGGRSWGQPSPVPQRSRPDTTGPAEARAMLAEAVAGIELGEYDRQVLALVSASEGPVLTALASLIARAGTHRLAQQHESHLTELRGILDALEDERVFGGEQSPTMRTLVNGLRLRLGRQVLDR